jgi:ESCRT-I complex subunit VPS28
VTKIECSRATERLRVGIPATVEQGPTHKVPQQGDHADATLIVNATETFITMQNAIQMGMQAEDLLAKDTLHPLLVGVIQAVNKVADRDFDNKGKIIQWLIKLNQMRASERLDEDQARDFLFDMDQAYQGFRDTLKRE